MTDRALARCPRHSTTAIQGHDAPLHFVTYGVGLAGLRHLSGGQEIEGSNPSPLPTISALFRRLQPQKVSREVVELLAILA